jgi:hypothetical protein
LASRSKTKTTMSKLNRERKVLEKRMEKQARKELRKLAAAEPPAETPEEPQPPASADDTG